MRCPECFENVIRLYKYIPGLSREVFTVYPVGFSRPIPPEVGNPYRQDFADACAVLTISPKASAALSRRCLQSILKDKGRYDQRDLNDQISELMGTLPSSYIAEDLHAVRTIGNFAAHPIKSTSTGEIVDVEPGEAEWNIEVLESLFDFYFVQPALSAKRKAELNQKLRRLENPH